jgi:hypothetical protein
MRYQTPTLATVGFAQAVVLGLDIVQYDNPSTQTGRHPEGLESGLDD